MTTPIKIKDCIIGSGIPKICVPLTAPTRDLLCAEAKAALEAGADLVEWRADFYEDLFEEDKLKETLTALSDILSQIPLLFTIRTKEEGGNCHILLKDYVNINKTAAQTGKADLIDVEAFRDLEEMTSLIAYIHTTNVKVIASSHDFQKTDAPAALLKYFQTMDTTGADILKMAVMPKTFDDVAAIMQVTSQMAREYTTKPLISMVMGKTGAISRISGEVFGSAVTFGTVGAASAPGQFPLEKLRSLMEALH